MVTAFIQVWLVFKINKPFMTYILSYFLTAVILKRLKQFCPFATLIENLCQKTVCKVYFILVQAFDNFRGITRKVFFVICK